MDAPPSPILGLRMKENTFCHKLLSGKTEVMVKEEVKVLMTQDLKVYKCEEYQTSKEAPLDDDDSDDCPSLVRDDVSSKDDSSSEDLESDIIDGACREKLCEWMFRVVDHFHHPREIVSVAFSYLDRFINKYYCNQKAYKLAAMTSLYLAAKMFTNLRRRITIKALANLSRGEFDVTDIEQMELLILKGLKWRLNPPTAQSFINSWYGLLSSLLGTEVSRNI